MTIIMNFQQQKRKQQQHCNNHNYYLRRGWNIRSISLVMMMTMLVATTKGFVVVTNNNNNNNVVFTQQWQHQLQQQQRQQKNDQYKSVFTRNKNNNDALLLRATPMTEEIIPTTEMAEQQQQQQQQQQQEKKVSKIDNNNIESGSSSSSSNSNNKAEKKGKIIQNKLPLRLVLIDHYDSFTYNLYDYLAQICVEPPIVFTKDSFDTYEQMMSAINTTTTTNNNNHIDGIILSPGPGTPNNANDIGTLALDIVANAPKHIPILGVCLGHQILGHYYNATIKCTPSGPIHGQIHTCYKNNYSNDTNNNSNNGDNDIICNNKNNDKITTTITTKMKNYYDNNKDHGSDDDKDPLWYNIPSSIEVVRYHSLIVDLGTQEKTTATRTDPQKQRQTQSSPLIPTAYCYANNNATQDDEEKILMGMKHEKYPHYGVQFHPESIGTRPYGFQLMENFCQLCYHVKSNNSSRSSSSSNNNHNEVAKEKEYENIRYNNNNINHDQQLQPPKQQQQTKNEKNDNDNSIDSSSILSAQQQRQQLREQQPSFEVLVHKITMKKDNNSDDNEPTITPAMVFNDLYASSEYSIWLDTSANINSNSHTNTNDDSDNDDDNGSNVCSIMGGLSDSSSHSSRSSNSNRIEYYGKEYPRSKQGVYRYKQNSQKEEMFDEDILTYLQRYYTNPTDSISLLSFNNDNHNDNSKDYKKLVFLEDDEDYDNNKNNGENNGSIASSSSLPFDYRGGHVGYLGYEVRYDTQQKQQQRKNNNNHRDESNNNNNDDNDDDNDDDDILPPTAAFLFLTKSLVYDHIQNEWYSVALVPSLSSSLSVVESEESNNEYEKEVDDAIQWMKSISNYMGKKQKEQQQEKERETTIPVTQEEKPTTTSKKEDVLTFLPQRSKELYNQNFDDCQEYIRLGESYELCLTNRLVADVRMNTNNNAIDGENPSSLQLYNILRRRNPAPFSAFMNWNSAAVVPTPPSSLSTSVLLSSSSSSVPSPTDTMTAFSICCSSPERFISVKRQKQQRQSAIVATTKIEQEETQHQSSIFSSQEIVRSFLVESKPIKGTTPRILPKDGSLFLTKEEQLLDERNAIELQKSIKDRAENLMIVDLLRNDLSRVCDVGSVHVSKLMDIESYATVHQMVSTIRGKIIQKQPQQLSPQKIASTSTQERSNTDHDYHNHRSSSSSPSSSPSSASLDDLNGGSIGDATSASAVTTTVATSTTTTCIDVLKETFPGGSMTGAPKLRTIELLHTLEGKKRRGPYSGCLGYISMNGSMDMNIIIRTALLTPKKENKEIMKSTIKNTNDDSTILPSYHQDWKVRIGTGGAIIALSEIEDEYQETMLKASAVMKSVQEWARSNDLLNSSISSNANDDK